LEKGFVANIRIQLERPEWPRVGVAPQQASGSSQSFFVGPHRDSQTRTVKPTVTIGPHPPLPGSIADLDPPTLPIQDREIYRDGEDFEDWRITPWLLPDGSSGGQMDCLLLLRRGLDAGGLSQEGLFFLSPGDVSTGDQRQEYQQPA